MRKMNRIVAVLVLLASGTLVRAQTNRPADSSIASQLTTSQVVDAWITIAETHLVPAAEAMPEEKYSFAPSNGEFKDVRTFASQVKHLAAANYGLAAKMMGEKPTADQQNETGPESVKTKAEIMEYLKGSFTSLHHAAATLDEKNLVEAIRGATGTWQKTRLGLAIDAVTHSFDHYGQIVEYMRMNGIVPPASR
jgi:uncharacterized damage-inducible protein DinB